MADLKLTGHVKEANRRILQAQRRAERADLLTESQLLGNVQLLHKAIDGEPISPAKLANFRLEVMRAKRQFGFTEGITARDAINLSNRSPHRYTRPQNKPQFRSDFDKARLEIKKAVPASAVGDTLRVVTSASLLHKETQHYVTIKMLGWGAALEAIATKRASPAQAARQLRKGRLKFACTCDRWTFNFSYIATIGGYNAGPPQRGFPKIRNEALNGCACKHALRALNEFDASGFWLNFLESHLRRAAVKLGATKLSQKEVKAHKPAKLKTEAEMIRERIKQRERDALKRALKANRDNPPPPPPPSGLTKRLATMTKQAAAKALGAMFGMSLEQVLATLTKASKR